MSSTSIRAKVKAGLAKAAIATGSATSEKVYLLTTSSTGGSPLSPGTTSSSSTLLKNAVFKSYSAKMLSSTILAGDRMIVCDNAVAIKQGNKIQQGSAIYIVIDVDIKAPTSDVLVYIAQVRLK